MIRALFLSIAQLGDRRILAVLVKSLVVTLLLFLALAACFALGARAMVRDGLHWGSGVGDLAAAAAVIATVGLAWLLFRAVAIAVTGIFADEVVAAVEARHYPAALASARPVPFARGVAMGLGSAGRVIAVNLLLSPLYLVLLATGVGTAIAFFLVNGWLLGRDLGDMVAARHLPAAAMRGWRSGTGGGRLLLGLAGTGLLMVPLVNFVAPVLGAAMATHWFHERRGK
ncbi:EI24 domain-containing protein [Sphingomonas sp. PL-96]|uniref:EI24 domain-containing protein n=1 Tax=Sphingomonas sp. PL-96 TaxID=2887201 RepID=UPI001E4254AA|nr:EI24 domain-containing protein [Sphingomonas sp. PL-96]MCC2975235.1 EI24 domain-containing protein [Sphingomonas sp. PL-96]